MSDCSGFKRKMGGEKLETTLLFTVKGRSTAGGASAVKENFYY